MKKIIIIVGALIIIVGGYLLFSLSSSNKSSSQNGSEIITDEGFSISQDGGTFVGKYEEPSALDFGLKVYANSEPADGNKSAGKFEMNGIKMMSATFKSADSREKIESFYTNQFGSDLQKGEIIDGDRTYRMFKSKSNQTAAFVNVWVENKSTYFTILKTI